MSRVVRDMGKADDGHLAGIQDAVTRLLGDYEQFMGNDLVTFLCAWREAAQRRQVRRSAQEAAVTTLSARPHRHAS